MALHIIKGIDSPVTLQLVPTEIGQHFVDTVNGDTYESVGTNSSADWKQTNNGGAVATSFLDLDDTPGVYGVGSAGQVATVNPGENALIFQDPTGAVESVFTRTGDVVAESGDYDADEIDETGTRVFLTPSELAQIGANSTAISNKPDNFLELDDSPANYAGSARKTLVVTEGETGVEFADPLGDIPMSTSLLSGCDISINADPTKFDVAEGLGVHVDNTTNPGFPVVTLVTVPEQLAVVVTGLLTQVFTVLSIDINGNIIQRDADSTPTQRRDTFDIGTVIHALGTISEAAIVYFPVYDTAAQLNDLMQAIGFFSTSGNGISGVTGTLSLQKDVGTGFSRGINIGVNKKDPSNTILAAQNPAFFIFTTAGSGVIGAGTILDPTLYEEAGVITTVPANNNATIQYIFLLANNQLVNLMGQELFANFSSAVDAAGSESFIVPAGLVDALFIARVVLIKSATDTTDEVQVRIITTGAVSAGGGGGSGADTTMQQSYNVSVQPQVVLDAGLGGIEYRDAATPIGSSLFKVVDSAGTSDFIDVDADRVKVIDLVSDGLTANRALATDATKKLISTATTDTELGFVAGVTSSVQDQLDDKQDEITAGTISQYFRGDKVFQELNKAAVGLANVDNTTDALKPISDATQTALDDKQDEITAGTISQYFRGDKVFQELNKAAVGLANVDNTSDASKPISDSTQTALDAIAEGMTVVELDLNVTASPTLENGNIYLVKPSEVTPTNNTLTLPTGDAGVKLIVIDINSKFFDFNVNVIGTIDGSTDLNMDVAHCWVDYYYSVDDTEWKTADPFGGGFGGGNNFLGLSDTPPEYTGDAGRPLQVNAIEDGVEYGEALVVRSGNLADIPGTDFSSGTFKYQCRDGACTMLVSQGTHSSSDNPTYGVMVTDAAFRPTATVNNVYLAGGSDIRTANLESNGVANTQYRDYTGSSSSRTNSGAWTLTWLYD